MRQRSSLTLNRAALLVALAGAPLAARAQPPADIPDIATVNESAELDGPPNLPGHERGDREKPAAEPAAEPAAPEAREWFGFRHWLEWTRVTGDWAGARTTLEDAGFTLAGSYTLDWSSVWAGGIRGTGSTRTLFDLNATFDLEKLAGLQGGTVFVDYFSSDMRGGSRDVGDYQGVSNIETGRNLDILAEAWYEQAFLENSLRLKAGKIDAAGEFAFLNCTGDFLHSAAGVMMTTPGYPTYPDPAMGLVLYYYPTEQFYLGGGVFDGATSDGVPTGYRSFDTLFSDDRSASWFWIGEAGFTWHAECGNGRACIGATYVTSHFDTFDGGTQDGAAGFYIMGEQQLTCRDEEGKDADHGLFVFAQAGLSDDEVWPVQYHLAGGLVIKGTFEGRDDDTTGALISYVRFADGSGLEDGETAIEFYYRFQLTPAINIRPDIQFILNPGGDPTLDDAVVAGLRAEITF